MCRADSVLHLAANGVEIDIKRAERLGGDPLAFGEEPQQQVLGTDIIVAEAAGFLLGEGQHLAGTFGESVKHLYFPPSIFL
jgi:hypothetical protein